MSPRRFCQAKTWAQTRSGGWGNSNVGCLRRAVTEVDDGQGNRVWSCGQHAARPPANGWDVTISQEQLTTSQKL